MNEEFVSFNPKVSNYDDYKKEEYPEKLFYSLIALVSTPKGTHPYDPNFGVGIRSYLMEVDNGQVVDCIEHDIQTAIQTYIPEIYEFVKVVASREYHPSGRGFVYKVNIVIRNMIVDFSVTKQGTLMYNTTH